MRSTALAVTLCLATPAAAEVHFARMPRPDGHVYLWPINLHLGYGYVADAERASHAFGLGADVATLSYNALVIDPALMRMVFRDACGTGSDCGITADFLVGSRVAWARYFGEDDVHQLSVGGMVGWGSLGESFGGALSQNGQLILGPSLRYAVFGLAGIEVVGLVPVGPVGEHRPFGLLINVVGLGSALVALAGMK